MKLLMTARAVGHGRLLCYAKKLGFCPLENGGYSLEGPALSCGRICFASNKSCSGVGHRVSWREILWEKGMLSLCRGEEAEEGLAGDTKWLEDEEETNWVS